MHSVWREGCEVWRVWGVRGSRPVVPAGVGQSTLCHYWVAGSVLAEEGGRRRMEREEEEGEVWVWVSTRPELIIHLKWPIIQLFYSQKLALLFKIDLPIIQTISPIIQVIYT